MTTIYAGPVVNPLSLSAFRALPSSLIAVARDGNILWLVDHVDPLHIRDVVARRGIQDYTLVLLKPGEFIMPGLVDTHTFPNLGVGGDLELLDWLATYTFPAESRFKDLDYAERMYTDVVQRVIASGTTTCCYYGSLHRDSTMLLADIVRKKGQRAFVGKCNMNWHCPDYYVEASVEESVSATADLIRYIQALPLSSAQEPLVHPIITPRFAISCTPELLAKLGELAESMPAVPIQTHISENRKEVEDTLKYFQADSYAAIYDKFKLLRRNTILAHAVWLTEQEMDLIAKKGAGVAHCPTSNFYLSSGMARVGMLLDHGVKVGLGSDVSGGYNPSILHAIQMASVASKMVAIQAEPNKSSRVHEHERHAHVDRHSHTFPIPAQTNNHFKHEHGEGGSRRSLSSTPANHPERDHDRLHKGGKFANKTLGVATLFYLATKGGAEVCCLQDRVGSFEPGKAFDALLVSIRNEVGNSAMWSFDLERDPSPESDLKQWLERFLFCGDNRNIKKVIVQGAVIGGQEHEA